MGQVRILVVVVLLATLLGGCPRVGRSNIPGHGDSVEVLVGRYMDRRFVRRKMVYRAPALAAYLSRLGRRLAARSGGRRLPWTFRILDGDKVTALAAPGGYIYITRQMLALLKNEAELAAVLCHEIAHVTARHHLYFGDDFWSEAERLNKSRRQGHSLDEHWGWLRSQLPVARFHHQLEADTMALDCLRRNGYPRRALYQMLSTTQRAEAREYRARKPKQRRRSPRAVRHPEWIKRLARARKLLGAAANPDRPLPEDAVFLRRLSGLIVAPNPAAGVRADGHYYNPTAGFQLSVPRGWSARVFRDRVVAVLPGKPAVLLIYPAKQTSPQKALQSFVHNGRKVRGRAVVLRGLRAVRGQVGIGHSVRAKVVAFRAKGAVFMVALITPRAHWPGRAALFTKILSSLRPLARPPR